MNKINKNYTLIVIEKITNKEQLIIYIFLFYIYFSAWIMQYV